MSLPRMPSPGFFNSAMWPGWASSGALKNAMRRANRTKPADGESTPRFVEWACRMPAAETSAASASKGHDFTACRKTHSNSGFVSGHDLSVTPHNNSSDLSSCAERLSGSPRTGLRSWGDHGAPRTASGPWGKRSRKPARRGGDLLLRFPLYQRMTCQSCRTIILLICHPERSGLGPRGQQLVRGVSGAEGSAFEVRFVSGHDS